MLQLILGLSGTGKTGRILALMKARALAGGQSILVVPEQFSSSAETMVYRTLGDRLGSFVEVYSFTSLAELFLKTFGGVCVPTLTDAARAVAVRRALDVLGDEAQNYHRHRRSTGFCNLCAEAIKELKIAGSAPEDVLRVAGQGTDGEKLRELGLLFAAYEKIIAGSSMDPSDRLTVGAQRMDVSFLKDKEVFIDNFDGFTAPQYRILEKLIQAKQCTVALCCDGMADHDAGMGLFSPVKMTAQRLRRIAGRVGVEVAAPKILKEDLRHKDAPGLLAVSQVLAGDTAENCCAENVYLTPAQNVYAECKAVACRIASLVRNEGYAYKDIAVICRLLDDYDAPVRYEFGLAEIPCFTDRTDTMEHTSVAAFLNAALELLSKGLTTEPLLRLLKTDLCGYTATQIANLENYAYTWRLKAAEWRAPFEKNPSGFGAQMTEEEQHLLQEVNQIREQVVCRVETFLKQAKGKNAAEISRQLYFLLVAFGADQETIRIAQEFEDHGDLARSEAMYRTWDEAMQLLGEMEQLLGQDEVTASEYAELFLLLVRSRDLGHVPETQDAVMLTTADRMRLDSPKICFVLGVSEGQFPKLAGASGLLTHADRDLLVNNGVQMPGGYENRTLLEQMFFYRALTAPSQRLYISYISPESGGAPVSAALSPVMELSVKPDRLEFFELAPTCAAALDLYGSQYRDDTPQTASLAQALAQEQMAVESLAAMNSAAHPAPMKAKDTSAMEKVIGRHLRLSPTRVEQYYRCRFSYFLQYVLKIKPRRRAELSPMESGSLIHYILEQVMRQAGAEFVNMPQEKLLKLADRIADDYVKENMPEASVRFAYLVRRLKRSVGNLLCYLQKEQAQSSFHPMAFEQPIGDGEGAVRPLTLKTPDGHTVQVVGQVDRVDVMCREGRQYVRVVDYKTGSKSFSLDDVYCGLNTQMLLYLFTLCQNETHLENPVAAGVLYLLSDPAPGSVTREQAADIPLYKVDGLVLNDEVVLRGMDKQASGLFVPVSFLKSGAPRTSSKLAHLEKIGNIQRHVEQLVIDMAKELYEGDIRAVPLRNATHCPCDNCDYRAVCRHEDGKDENFVHAPKGVFETSGERNEND
ncbi:PD-(D/E)XK nuclease family protein [uncultured Ruthenibacterium sp.]|uniref:PD-(D/E)XK nuclease family protein n=1 Tax=uncultured Ruthenibacterium sp. TaxID=1905347 RepID=UPI00349EFB2D